MKASRVICVIDDEPMLREVVRRYLEHDGFEVLEAETGPEGLDLIQNNPVDLVLLDIMLPGLDGFGLLHLLRRGAQSAPARTQASLPVIMLTSRNHEMDRIAGFDLGIDDYVVKPFSPRELVARVNAVLRRVDGAPHNLPESAIQYGNLEIDPQRRMVRTGAGTPALTAREFDLLWVLASHPRQVFTREQLLTRVWGYEFSGDDSTVTVHIRRLREKLEDDPSHPRYIQTVWGVGYRFEPESQMD